MDAVEGRIMVGRWERLTCLRHVYDLARAGQLPGILAKRVEKATTRPLPTRDPDWQWVFDEEQASFVAIDWFSRLVHVWSGFGIVGYLFRPYQLVRQRKPMLVK